MIIRTWQTHFLRNSREVRKGIWAFILDCVWRMLIGWTDKIRSRGLYSVFFLLWRIARHSEGTCSRMTSSCRCPIHSVKMTSQHMHLSLISQITWRKRSKLTHKTQKDKNVSSTALHDFLTSFYRTPCTCLFLCLSSHYSLGPSSSRPCDRDHPPNWLVNLYQRLSREPRVCFLQFSSLRVKRWILWVELWRSTRLVCADCQKPPTSFKRVCLPTAPTISGKMSGILANLRRRIR